MHFVVPLKQVHDPNTPPNFMAVRADGKSLELHSAATQVLNAYDANALEAAVSLKEKHGGIVTALSVGDNSSVAHIRRAIAMGADRGILIEGPTGIDCDSRIVGTLLHAAISKLEPTDLVLCGRQASDTDAGQVPFFLAEQLGFTAVSPVVAVGVDPSGAFAVDRITDGGIQRLQIHGPAVLGISNEINKPRAPGLKGVMLSKKAEVPVWTSPELGIEPPTASQELVSLALTERPVILAEIISASTPAEAGRALADRLKSEGFF